MFEFTFPNMFRMDTLAAKQTVPFSCAFLVAFDFCTPNSPVHLWNMSAFGASVPKTSINKYCNLLFREIEIRASWNWHVKTPSRYSGSNKSITATHFCRAISFATYFSHRCGALWRDVPECPATQLKSKIFLHNY